VTTHAIASALRVAPSPATRTQRSFTDVMRPAQAGHALARSAEAPLSAVPPSAGAPAAPSGIGIERRAIAALDSVQRAQARMEQVLRLAQSGRTFSPAELLSLQATMYRSTQELDLAGKVVEKLTAGTKQLLQTPV
jgi:hypothetical protein